MGGEGKGKGTDLGSQGGGFINCAKQLGGLLAFAVFHFLIVQKAHAGTAVDEPGSIMLNEKAPKSQRRDLLFAEHGWYPEAVEPDAAKGEDMLTSFLVTGFSITLRCVSLGSRLRMSKSESSEMLLAVRIKVVRLGVWFGRLDWILVMRLRARRSVRRRGE